MILLFLHQSWLLPSPFGTSTACPEPPQDSLAQELPCLPSYAAASPAWPWQQYSHSHVSSGALLPSCARLKAAFVKPVHAHARNHLSTNLIVYTPQWWLVNAKENIFHFSLYVQCFCMKNWKMSTLKGN